MPGATSGREYPTEGHPRPVAGHPEGGPSHLAPVLSASSSIGLITKAENRLKPMTSGPVSRGLSPDEYVIQESF